MDPFVAVAVRRRHRRTVAIVALRSSQMLAVQVLQVVGLDVVPHAFDHLRARERLRADARSESGAGARIGRASAEDLAAGVRS